MSIKNLFFVLSFSTVFGARGMSDQIGRMKVFDDKKFILEKSAQAFFCNKDTDFGALTLNSAECYYSLRNNKGYITFEKKVGNNIFVSYLKPETNEAINNGDELTEFAKQIYLLCFSSQYQHLTGFYVKRIKKDGKNTFEFRPKKKFRFLYAYAQHFAQEDKNQFKKTYLNATRNKIKSLDTFHEKKVSLVIDDRKIEANTIEHSQGKSEDFISKEHSITWEKLSISTQVAFTNIEISFDMWKDRVGKFISNDEMEVTIGGSIFIFHENSNGLFDLLHHRDNL